MHVHKINPLIFFYKESLILLLLTFIIYYSKKNLNNQRNIIFVTGSSSSPFFILIWFHLVLHDFLLSSLRYFKWHIFKGGKIKKSKKNWKKAIQPSIMFFFYVYCVLRLYRISHIIQKQVKGCIFFTSVFSSLLLVDVVVRCFWIV